MKKEEKEIKAGLEVHQQLDTNKLFCKCPSILRNDNPAFQISRKLHAVPGESGEVDVAVEYEVGKEREFIYQGYDTTCLVELDESPPELINKDALIIGLHVALLLNCEILPITQIMRKTVIDGSNTSGFQRTTLIARNGWIETGSGRIRIDNISLEEDAARIIGKENNKRIFRLDRLGIPLIEIGTAPDIKNAEQCKEAALYIGDILRSCKVKRGIGTIRQDVNISIKAHPRVEIKGFQDVRMFIPVINNEIKRQEDNLANLKKTGKFIGEVRNALPNGETEFLRPMPGVARMYPETDLPLLKISREIINEAKRTLPKLRQEIRKELSKIGLKEHEIKILLKQNKLEDFEFLSEIINEPRFIFKVLIEIPNEISAKENKTLSEIENILTIDIIERIASVVKNNKISVDNVKHFMEEIVKGKSFEEAIKTDKIDANELESEIAKLVKEKPGLSINAYMGLVMQKFKGKISGKEANEILNKLIK
ncbi:MAG: Glu-tRNA(Gln) amidotransferase subunit GatE [Nanoarchaeota archaeon]